MDCVGRALLDFVPWLKSQNVPRQFEIRPSVRQTGQRQTTTSFSVVLVSTPRRSRLGHLRQTGLGASSGSIQVGSVSDDGDQEVRHLSRRPPFGRDRALGI
jgi:hypothetical protein